MATPASQREITYVIRMRNESQAAIRQFANDLSRLNRVQVGSGGAGGPGGSRGFPSVGDAETLNRVLPSLARGFTANAIAVAGWGGAIATAGSAVQGIIRDGDAANQMIGRLSASLGNRQLAENVFAQLARDAQAMGLPLEQSVQMFQRFDLAARESGRSLRETQQFTRTLQQLAVVSGTTGREASASFMQLGQALASGRLQGDELRSVLENFPQLAALIAQSMGVSVGELRKLGSEGKLTSDVIFRAVAQGQQQVEQQFRQMPLTVERAATKMAEGFSAVGRELDRQLGLSQNLARAMEALGNTAQRTADAMAPETTATRLRSINQELAEVARRQAEIASGEQSLRNQPSRNGISTGLSGAAASANAGSDRERIRALREEAEQIGELLRAEQRLAAHRQLADQASRDRAAVEAEVSRTRQAAREVLERFGLANTTVSQQIEALTRVQHAGEEAARKYGLSAEAAARFIGLLRQQVDPAAAAIAGLNNQLRILQAQGQGGITGMVMQARVALEGRMEPAALEAHLQRVAQLQRDIANATGRNRVQDQAEDLRDEQERASARRSRDANAGARAAGNIAARRAERDGITDPEVIQGLRQQAEARERLNRAFTAGDAATARRQVVTDNRIAQVRTETEALVAEAEALRRTGVEQSLEIDRIRARNQLRQNSSNTAPTQAAINARAEAEQARRQAEGMRDIERLLVQRRTGYQDELSTMNLTGDALERQRLTIEMTNEARRGGIDLGSQEFRDQLARGQEALAQFQRLREQNQSDPYAGLMHGLRKWQEESANVFQQMSDAVGRMGDSMTDAITEFAMTGKFNFRDFANSIIRDMIRIAAQQAIVRPLMGALSSGLGGLFGGGEAVAGAASAFGNSVMHSGGIVGHPSRMSRSAHAGLWAGAPRFHTGGMVGGLRSGERAIIAKDNEAVMPTVRLPDGSFGVKATGGGGGGSPVFAPTIIIQNEAGGAANPNGQGSGDPRAHAAMSRQMEGALKGMFLEWLVEQQRNGGALNPGNR